ncbi:uncharacterized protein LOC124268780 [Haliotis rubra]|uniref:uncharacterized protein LOC124268780 n=1 Tax=Haliotis rubra TaxID=36100 RepID=UPI001EE504AB|nr:uncharacterized protein LOC124268780 [Haliotis rubra]
MLSNVPETTLSEKMFSAVREKVLQTVMEENAAHFTLQKKKRSTGSEGPRSRPPAPGPDTFRFRPSSPSPVCPQNISTLREDSTGGPLPNTSQVQYGCSQIARVNHLLKIQTRQEELVNEYLARTSGRQEDLVSEYLRGASQDDLTRTYPAGAASEDGLTCTLPAGAEDQDNRNSTHPAGSASPDEPTTRHPFGDDSHGEIYSTDQARSVSQNDLTNRHPVGGASQNDLTITHPVRGESQNYLTSGHPVGGVSEDDVNSTHPAGGASQNDLLGNHPGSHDLGSECITSGNYPTCNYVIQTAGEDVADECATQTVEVSDHEIKVNQQCIKNVFISYSNDSVLAKAGSPPPTTSTSFESTQSMESLVLPPEMIKLPRHHLPFDVRNFCAENEDDEDDAMSQTERRLTSIAKGLRRKLFRKDEEVTLTQVIALAPGELLSNFKDLEDMQEDLDDLSLNSSGYSIDDLSSSSCNSSSESDEVSLMSNVRVRALHAYQARNTREISLDQGQLVKQKQGADDQGFSYGWTRAHKLAPKRYGYYPSGMVALPHSYHRKVRRYGHVEMQELEEGDRNVKPPPLLV